MNIRINKRSSFIITALLSAFASYGQSKISHNWHLLDREKDGVFGISADKSYKELLSSRKGKEVVVAIIDAGIDTLHEDLKSVLWNNKKERDNGKDNDNNGYIGDIHGWNFLGNKTDFNTYLIRGNAEDERVFFKYKDQFLTVSDPSHLSKDERGKYELWKLSKSSLDLKMKNKMREPDRLIKEVMEYDSFFRSALNKDEYTISEVRSYNPKNTAESKTKEAFMRITSTVPPDITSKKFKLSMMKQYNGYKETIKFPENLQSDFRDSTVGDNYYNIKDRYYGNANLRAEECTHGTHVAGIIGAVRGNGLGIDGIADNVRLMIIRAVPDGDEYDKDIALAIRYAVDNGADIINMSFGKTVSPEKIWVEEALKYAEKKDVLIVKAAGNDATNIDSINYFPNANYNANRSAKNFITVGASSPDNKNGELVASFSNYGKSNVDVFAPGKDIYSTIQGVNTYGNLSGTSMAAPVVTGIAALIKSYFPKLSAVQIKEAIESSVVKVVDKVHKPGTGEDTFMSELCKTGGIVNAYEALKAASNMYKN